jgi:hypothetical protein
MFPNSPYTNLLTQTASLNSVPKFSLNKMAEFSISHLTELYKNLLNVKVTLMTSDPADELILNSQNFLVSIIDEVIELRTNIVDMLSKMFKESDSNLNSDEMLMIDKVVSDLCLPGEIFEMLVLSTSNIIKLNETVNRIKASIDAPESSMDKLTSITIAKNLTVLVIVLIGKMEIVKEDFLLFEVWANSRDSKNESDDEF